MLKLWEVELRARLNHAYWLKNLVERLGAELTTKLWTETFGNYGSKLTQSILSSGWVPTDAGSSPNNLPDEHFILGDSFGAQSNGMSAQEAIAIIRETPPLPQIHQLHNNLFVQRETTVYEALHIYMHGMALITETLIDRLGKQGELLAYDIVSSGREGSSRGKTGTFADFIRQSEEDFTKPGMFAAGLEVERETVSPTEYMNRVKECEWARYFKEHHPRVGYLLACSTDEVSARAFNPSIRLQRTSTIMEGGSHCDFLWYTVDPEQEP